MNFYPVFKSCIKCSNSNQLEGSLLLINMALNKQENIKTEIKAFHENTFF